MKYTPTKVSRTLRKLGEHTQIQRKLLRLTLEDVAIRAGVNINTVRSIESGKPVRTDSLFAVMNILQLIDPMIEATNPYNTMLGMSRAIDELPNASEDNPSQKTILMSQTIQVHTTLQGQDVQAGTIFAQNNRITFRYTPEFLASDNAYDLTPALPRVSDAPFFFEGAWTILRQRQTGGAENSSTARSNASVFPKSSTCLASTTRPDKVRYATT